MLFNSLQFIIFFPIVVFTYFMIRQSWRWIFLLIASYYFYMCWKPEYLILIIISTLIDYVAAKAIAKSINSARRKLYLTISLCSNLGFLFFFKYFDFVNDSIKILLDNFNIFYDAPVFDLLLPVGISFYTFQSMSYTIDVYRRERAPENHLGIFALYVAFFPQLVAGPIERSNHLLPQFFEKHEFETKRVADGLRLMLWGFFKKLVIADNIGLFVDQVYKAPTDYGGLSLLVATYFFAFQIYCDFSAYSDIAIGAARVMGFDLMENFRQPYFSKSIPEFWRRWHISLSTWFRDYLYIPLGGSRVKKSRIFLNLFAVFILSGLWHGANWTFLVWGFLHFLYMLLSHVTKTLRARLRLPITIQILITFHLVLLSWVFFRARSISDSFYIIGHLFSDFDKGLALDGRFELFKFTSALFAIFILLLIDGLGQKIKFREIIARKPIAIQWGFYYASICVIAIFGEFGRKQFIYFQF